MFRLNLRGDKNIFYPMKVFSNTVDAFLYGGTLKSVTELVAFFGHKWLLSQLFETRSSVICCWRIS